MESSWAFPTACQQVARPPGGGCKLDCHGLGLRKPGRIHPNHCKTLGTLQYLHHPDREPHIIAHLLQTK
eukprot:2121124-Amphidinium_carterae.1